MQTTHEHSGEQTVAVSEPGWLREGIEEIARWTEAAYPEEGCGIIVSRNGHYRVITCENLANKYHAMDPETYPRTAETFYMINPMEFVKAEDRGERVEVVFHSHADVGDYFSDEDVAAATMPRESEDEPLEAAHPGVDYLVVSVRDGQADHASLFRFDSETGSFPVEFECSIRDGELVAE